MFLICNCQFLKNTNWFILKQSLLSRYEYNVKLSTDGFLTEKKQKFNW